MVSLRVGNSLPNETQTLDGQIWLSGVSRVSRVKNNIIFLLLVFLLHMFDDISTIVFYIVIVKSLYEAKVEKLGYSL